MEFIKVATIADFERSKAVMATVRGEEVAIFAVDGTYYAVADTCPHREGPLHEGLVEGSTVTCPWHFAKFDLSTGNVVEPPAESSIRTFEVRVDGEDVLIRASDGNPE